MSTRFIQQENEQILEVKIFTPRLEGIVAMFTLILIYSLSLTYISSTFLLKIVFLQVLSEHML